MDGNHPNRKKDKQNPYTLIAKANRYYLLFTDGQGVFNEMEIDKAMYDLFDGFELEDISHLNKVSRHYEHSELTEQSLNNRAFNKADSVEDTVIQDMENQRLYKAISELPEIQRRRLELYCFCGLTYAQIAEMEGCTKRAVKFSVDIAIDKLRIKF